MSKSKIYAPPIMMTKEYWLNSQFSIARYYGGIKFNGNEYRIVNEKGYFKELAASQTADLVIADWLPLYRKVGREKFIEIIKQTNDLTKAKEMARRDDTKETPNK